MQRILNSILIAVAASACVSASAKPVAAWPTPSEGAVLATDTLVQIVFPRDNAQQYPSHSIADQHMSKAIVAMWTARWVRLDAPWYGQEPDGLYALVDTARTDAPSSRDLQTTLSRATVYIGTSAYNGFGGERDSNVRIREVDGRVVFEVRGQRTVRRVFPRAVPDAMELASIVTNGEPRLAHAKTLQSGPTIRVP